MDSTPSLASIRVVDETTYIEIEETGKFLVPHDVLGREVVRSEESIVSIQIFDNEYFLLEARDGWVGTEVLSSRMRVEVRPKCGLDALDVLLAWSGGAMLANNSEVITRHLAAGDRLFDVFAARFLEYVQPILAEGLIFESARYHFFSNAVEGEIELDRSLAARASGEWFGFHQWRSVNSRDNLANAAIATTLLIIVQAVFDLSDHVRRAAASMLTEFTNVSLIEPVRAVESIAALVSNREISGNREYYYPALLAALPILQSVSRLRLGNIVAKDVALRVQIAAIFESAIRNALSRYLVRYSVKKGDRAKLYRAAPRVMQVVLEPDVTIRRLSDMQDVRLVVDAKYKYELTASDHYQMASYYSRFSPKALLMISLTETDYPLIQRGEGFRGESVVSYALPVTDMIEALSGLQRKVASMLETS